MVLGPCGAISNAERVGTLLLAISKTGDKGSPAFTPVQVAPASEVLNIPSSVIAYIVPGFCGSILRAVTSVGVVAFRSELTMVQVAPASVVLNTPAELVAAYIVAEFWGSIAKAGITMRP